MVDAVLSCSIATRSSTNLRSSAGNRTITGPIHCSGVFRLRPRKVLGPRITLTKRVVFHGIKLTPLAGREMSAAESGPVYIAAHSVTLQTARYGPYILQEELPALTTELLGCR